MQPFYREVANSKSRKSSTKLNSRIDRSSSWLGLDAVKRVLHTFGDIDSSPRLWRKNLYLPQSCIAQCAGSKTIPSKRADNSRQQKASQQFHTSFASPLGVVISSHLTVKEMSLYLAGRGRYALGRAVLTVRQAGSVRLTSADSVIDEATQASVLRRIVSSRGKLRHGHSA